MIVRVGQAEEVLKELLESTGADEVHWNRLYQPNLVDRDKRIKAALEEDGVSVKSHSSTLLLEPWSLTNASGDPYRVFTPFWKKLRSEYSPDSLLASPKKINSGKACFQDVSLAGLQLLPEIDWAEGLRNRWDPGESGAMKACKRFTKNRLKEYSENRNFPALDSNSSLSPYLHFGEISPRQVWTLVQDSKYESEVY